MSKPGLPPGPKGNLFSGNLDEFRRSRLGFLSRCAQDFGNLALVRFGPRRVFLAFHPDLIERVLVTDARHYSKHFALRLNPLVFGNGLLTSEAGFWLRQRRLIQPVFNRHSLAAYTPDMVAAADKIIDGWRHGETRDIMKEMERLMLAIAAKTLFDEDVNDDAQEIGRALQGLQDEFAIRFASLLSLPWWVPTPQNLRVRAIVRRLDKIIYRFIQHRRQNGADKHDLLSLLLRAQDQDDGSRMSDRQVRDEAMTLFLAGHETTALGLAWTWHLLAQHPAVEQRLHEELHDVLNGRTPTAADIPALHYTEQVLLESMRVYPPVYAIGREALCDCELGGYRVPRGYTVMMPQWVVHRDPRFFAEPERFRPERWTAQFRRDMPKFAYFPFGGGPRICIGNTFAMMEMTLVLAAIGQRFSLQMAEGVIEPKPTFTLQPAHGIPMRIERRTAPVKAATPGEASEVGDASEA